MSDALLARLNAVIDGWYDGNPPSEPIRPLLHDCRAALTAVPAAEDVAELLAELRALIDDEPGRSTVEEWIVDAKTAMDAAVALLAERTPREPTAEMIVAGANVEPPISAGEAISRWRAMYDAAPDSKANP